MIKRKIICNFSVIRFMPYPETEEFVNVGIALACPERATFEYMIENRRRDRVTHFFPEMDDQLFIEGRHMLITEMDRLCRGLNKKEKVEQARFHFAEKDFTNIFREIVKPRESLFRFGNIGTVLTEEPNKEIKELFAYYVERQFAQRDEYQETVMTKRLTGLFRAQQLLDKYKEQKFGDDLYHVTIPFVNQTGVKLRAIKPLDLDKHDTTKIIEHGDRWRMRITRLKEKNDFPQEMLFVIRQHNKGKHHDAAQEIRKELENLGTHTLPATDNDAIVDFARAV